MKGAFKPDARAEILAAAERRFAEAGFSGTSVRDIVAATGYSKPTLYYYFRSKAGLFRAILNHAHDECLRLVQQAAAKSDQLDRQLVETLAALFEHLRDRKDLTRLAFAAAFAAPKELPPGARDDSERDEFFNFFHQLMRRGQAAGTLDRACNSRDLAYGIYGALSFHLMANLLLPGTRLNRRAAEQIVRLFLEGAAAR